MTDLTGTELSVSLPRTIRSFEDFLKVDVYTGDSDPMYWAVARAYLHPEFGPEWAKLYALAMLTYYDSKLAFKAAEFTRGLEFWEFLENSYATAPRGSERRHFRGGQGIEALELMKQFSPKPEEFFQQMGDTYQLVHYNCGKYLKQFGPYFQLKVCDFMDRCLDQPIRDWKGLEKNLPSEPQKALELLLPDTCQVEGPVTAFLSLCEEFDVLAAPDFRRRVGPAEIETSLCGWKTTKFKGNWFGADIWEKSHPFCNQGARESLFYSFFPSPIVKNLFHCDL